MGSFRPRGRVCLIHVPDTSHLSAVHTTLQKAFPENCVPKERKTQANKRPFDHFIRVQPTTLPYAKTGTGNTDVTPGILSLGYHCKGRELCVAFSQRRTRLALLSSARVNKLAAKQILSLGCLYAFPLTWSLLSWPTACCGNVFPSAHVPAFFTFLPENPVSALMLLWGSPLRLCLSPGSGLGKPHQSHWESV